jgi:hypothetical protein
LEKLSRRLETEFIGEWRFLLRPWHRDAAVRQSVVASFKCWFASEAGDDVQMAFHWQGRSTSFWMLSLLYWNADQMQETEIALVLSSLMRTLRLSKFELDRLAASLQKHRLDFSPTEPNCCAVLPLLLFVDSSLAQFPLEACPCLSSLEVARGIAPNVALSAFQLRQRSSKDRSPDSLLKDIPTALRKRRPASPQRSIQRTENKQVPETGFYVLDPDKKGNTSHMPLVDLLLSWNASRNHDTWTGHVGRPFPASDEVMGKLGSEDVFIYMGHGQAARTLMKPEALQMGVPVIPNGERTIMNKRVPLRSVIMLMGCSTAKISKSVRCSKVKLEAKSPVLSEAAMCYNARSYTEAEFDAYGMPLSVLIGGGPVMIGALWDVLDGDLQQLSVALLEGWMPSAGSPKAESRTERTPSTSLIGALTRARQACRLRFLTGAAVVAYGIPI